MRKEKRRMRLRTRLLIVMLGVIFVVFASTAAIFNVLMNNYIRQTATAQLSAAAGLQTSLLPNGSVPGDMPDLTNTPPSRLNTRPVVFRMDAAYTVQTPGSASAAEVSTAQKIADQMKTKHLDPTNISGLQINAGGGIYYINSVSLTAAAAPAGDTAGALYMVFYVDVTGIAHFADSVNLFLILIMVAAVLITSLAILLITRRLTRPLWRLTAFSGRIGKGDFAPCKEQFHDRELAALADSMNRAAGQLEAYDKDQKIFFQNASHELRTPLMSIKCYAEGIHYGIMETQKASETILQETDRLSGMVEDLLTVSRIDNITKEQAPAPCDLRELLGAAAEGQRSVAQNKEVNVAFDFDETPVTMPGNDKTLYRAFSNLISNALRYANSAVMLTCKKTGQHITVAVADDGSGIDPADMPHIFERFYKGQDGGHGIGLSIVKAVVEQHGGQIGVQSDGTGTMFTIAFETAEE